MTLHGTIRNDDLERSFHDTKLSRTFHKSSESWPKCSKTIKNFWWQLEIFRMLTNAFRNFRKTNNWKTLSDSWKKKRKDEKNYMFSQCLWNVLELLQGHIPLYSRTINTLKVLQFLHINIIRLPIWIRRQRVSSSRLPWSGSTSTRVTLIVTSLGMRISTAPSETFCRNKSTSCSQD